MKTVLLAFSGGLDTSFCIPFFLEKGYEVITATVDTGGFSTEELQAIAKKSADLGAKEHVALDAQEELYQHFVVKIVQANYLRGGTYPSCVGPERIVAAKAIAKLALERGITTIAHGSTGAGNDQVRFDGALRAYIPAVEILAPIRDEGLTRAQEVEYLKKKGVEVSAHSKDYSINVGILGTTIGGKETKATLGLPPDEVYPHVKPIHQTPDEAESIVIGFETGEAVSVNGKKLGGAGVIHELNSVAEKHGVGKNTHLGATILGIKGRIAFEAPALSVLIRAHQELEKSVLTSRQSFWKNHLGTVWGDMIHEGQFFDPVVEDIEAMIDSSQRYVTGTVSVELLKGNITVLGSESEYSLLDTSIGTYGEENALWNGADARGFCKLYGLEGSIAFQKHQKK
ncbi:MAG: argininosuccinate synthase [bacterium]|nr:argininosuccinate synthase [bacterium]